MIITGLGDNCAPTRLACTKCILSLSRSVRQLRTCLIDAGLAQPLFQLLFDTDIEVQVAASAALCNIILDFSPMKQIIIEKGGVTRLVQLILGGSAALRLNAIWALKNMLYQADLSLKRRVMDELGWNNLSALVDDSNIALQEQALSLLRNLVCGGEKVDIFYLGY